MKTKFICLLSLLLLFSCDHAETDSSDSSIVGWWEWTNLSKNAIPDGYRCFIEFTPDNALELEVKYLDYSDEEENITMIMKFKRSSKPQIVT